MFGIPGEVFWPTAAVGSLILLVFGSVVVLRLLPAPKSRASNQPEREPLEDIQARLGQLEQLQLRVSELEERLDFAERLLAQRREAERLSPPRG